MKTYTLRKNNRAFAFEIENIYIGLRKIKFLLSDVEGVSDIDIRRLFVKSNGGVHARFKYKDEKFIVWEPYGDNSRYWIGPEDENIADVDISQLEQAFQEYKLPLFIKIVGSLVSLNFKALFKDS